MSDSITIPWAIQTGVTGILALLFFIFKWWMAKEFTSIKEHMELMVSDKLCLERSNACSAQQCRKTAEVVKDVEGLTAVMYKHGHRGLVGDDNRVVR